ncbi:pimeloyl-ACP methyl ester carboxylesterase [Rhizobium sp. SG_E_25_P2]|uniref:alpha/beta fold hydrolase n=1 Tax=Rhizobium sp. SG_E_25_P2 TaxID=2879942 RepID=UPI0024757141|nr:alpha/beta hydrolase [Rhizobium sp. SG_E_25_P2]MDH6264870.1 pimeloyl-ACP methyl ester carboxylesterase [Rhizobium sp. SG_E_25_P2]
MYKQDDQLIDFERDGLTVTQAPERSGYTPISGARIWWALHGERGPCVILLHGGLGHSGNWANQITPLLDAGYRVLLIDTRGHGHSTRDVRPLNYQLLSCDVLAVCDGLGLERFAVIGWSDGACIGLELCRSHPLRIAGLLFFACNIDPSGAKPFELTPEIERCFSRHGKDYARLSETPEDFQGLVDIVSTMQRSEPNLSAQDLAAILTPVTVVQAEHDEFIKPEHAEYLARALGEGALMRLPGVSHFAPIQRPYVFNAAALAFLKNLEL